MFRILFLLFLPYFELSSITTHTLHIRTRNYDSFFDGMIVKECSLNKERIPVKQNNSLPLVLYYHGVHEILNNTATSLGNTTEGVTLVYTTKYEFGRFYN